MQVTIEYGMLSVIILVSILRDSSIYDVKQQIKDWGSFAYCPIIG